MNLPTAPIPVYRLMESNADALAAIEQVVRKATRTLCLFDTNPRSLRERGFGDPARMEVLRRLLLATRAHRLRFALHETQGIESELPRLINLLTQFSGQIEIHRTLGRARDAQDSLIIADDAHFWRKLHIDHPRSVLTLDNAVDTRPILERFEEIWEKSELAATGSSLGL